MNQLFYLWGQWVQPYPESLVAKSNPSIVSKIKRIQMIWLSGQWEQAAAGLEEDAPLYSKEIPSFIILDSNVLELISS